MELGDKQADKDYSYPLLVLEAAHHYTAHNLPPVAGGLLDQPAALWDDMRIARELLREREEIAEDVEKSGVALMKTTSMPDVPLPRVPKELLDA